MIDLALDPSETRRVPDPTGRGVAGRPWTRIALFGVLGIAGTGAFASAANTYLSGLAGPQRAQSVVVGQKAADWPDLKDGLPALAGASVASVPKVREILPPAPATPPVVEARIEPSLRTGPATVLDAVAMPPTSTGPVAASGPVAAPATKPPPAIVNVPVIGPTRQAALVPPPRTVSAFAPLATETVRARTGNATYAALPPENAKGVAIDQATARDDAIKSEASKAEVSKAEAPKAEASKAEASKAKPRIEAHARPPAAAKPLAVAQPPAVARTVAEKPSARKPVAVEANAAPVEAGAQDEDTEVFGIKVPSLAPAGRKFRESVEALGDAVKGIPDRF